MSWAVSLLRGAAVLAGCWWLSGCLPSAQSQLDEEKETHFLAGKSRLNTMDYKGAVEAFEKALEVNPRSASAHFELACLYEQREADPAAAVYHYDHYLRLRPNAGNAGIVKDHIMTCKQELARTVSLAPVTEKVQRDLEQLAEENRRLGEENKRLHEELDKWRALSAARPAPAAGPLSVVTQPPRVAPLSNPVPAIPSGTAAASLTGGARPAGETGVAPTPRTHTVKQGETPSLIARRYGIRVEALMAANPGLDARRLQVGQSLSIPGP